MFLEVFSSGNLHIYISCNCVFVQFYCLYLICVSLFVLINLLYHGF
nr:MAG TPA: hypothetical protein [Caudoviricetes sp.]